MCPQYRGKINSPVAKQISFLTQIRQVRNKIREMMGKKKLLEMSVEGDTIVINLDLRPVELPIYTDLNALHVGGSQLSQNIIKQSINGISIG